MLRKKLLGGHAIKVELKFEQKIFKYFIHYTKKKNVYFASLYEDTNEGTKVVGAIRNKPREKLQYTEEQSANFF